MSKDRAGGKRGRLIVAAVVIAVVGMVIAAWLMGGEKEGDYAGARYRVRRMDLEISVLENGSLESSNLLEVKSRVEGQTRIISIVPDGTVIAEEDVRNGKVLVTLDSSNLVEKAEQQEITFQSATAASTQAREGYEIQKNQNESDIQSGLLDVKFARMDFEKYLGKELATRVLEGKVEFGALSAGEMELSEGMRRLRELGLGGVGLQTLRRLETDIDIAEEEVKRARDKYEWSRRLGPEGKGYISGTEVEADRLALKTRETDEEQARLALGLFLQYEFPKEMEELYSGHVEAQRELGRIRAKARSELAQKEAAMKSKAAAYRLQKSRLEKLREQIENCTIRATLPGMVVYASTSGFWRRRSADQIQEGATVRERQAIFNIPDPTNMSVSVLVHEASVNKVKMGQKVRITVDALPDRGLRGTVRKVSVLPDVQNPWLSPNLKVYPTNISIEDPPEVLKTGMTVKAEILVDSLTDVIAVPITAVTTRNGRRVCYVLNNGRPEMRRVEVGQFNDEYIEVKEGLTAGEEVLLRVPDAVQSGEESPAEKADADERGTAAAPESPERSERTREESPETRRRDDKRGGGSRREGR